MVLRDAAGNEVGRIGLQDAPLVAEGVRDISKMLEERLTNEQTPRHQHQARLERSHCRKGSARAGFHRRRRLPRRPCGGNPGRGSDLVAT